MGGLDPRAATDKAFPHQTVAPRTRGLVPPALTYDMTFRKKRDFPQKIMTFLKIMTFRKKTNLTFWGLGAAAIYEIKLKPQTKLGQN